MKYDFQTLVSRKNVGSSKWNLMSKHNLNIDDSIIPFSVADMEFKNSPEIIDGLKEYIDSSIFGYTVATEEYYKSVCNWMDKRHNWKINRDWIIEFPGVVPALYMIIRALTKENDNVLLMTPVYYPFYNAINTNKRNIVTTELKLNEDHYEIDFEDLERKAKLENTSVLILCNPHNPVGRVWRKDELENIGRICIDNNVLIISDEIHFDLIMDGFEHTVFANISEEFANNSVTCTAPSKTFNLAGIQASNIIASNKKIRDKIIKEKRLSIGNLGLNIFAYKACEIAYKECEEWLDELLVILNSNKKLVSEFIKTNLPEIKVINLEGTYLQWLDFRTLEKDHIALEKFMIHEARLFLDEGYIFGREGQGFERINLACPTKILEEALNRLFEAVKRIYNYR